MLPTSPQVGVGRLVLVSTASGTASAARWQIWCGEPAKANACPPGMKLASLQRDHDACLQKATELLGTPVRAVALYWEVEQLLRKHLRLVTRLGLCSEHPI